MDIQLGISTYTPDRAHQQGRRRPFPVIVDVREEAHFVLGHIDGAKRISPDSLEESMRDVVPDLATPIVVYCAAGAPGGTLMLEVGISSRLCPLTSTSLFART